MPYLNPNPVSAARTRLILDIEYLCECRVFGDKSPENSSAFDSESDSSFPEEESFHTPPVLWPAAQPSISVEHEPDATNSGPDPGLPLTQPSDSGPDRSDILCDHCGETSILNFRRSMVRKLQALGLSFRCACCRRGGRARSGTYGSVGPFLVADGAVFGGARSSALAS